MSLILTQIADRVAAMTVPVTHAEDAAYAEGYNDALRRTESLLRWLHKQAEQAEQAQACPPAPPVVRRPDRVLLSDQGWTRERTS